LYPATRAQKKRRPEAPFFDAAIYFLGASAGAGGVAGAGAGVIADAGAGVADAAGAAAGACAIFISFMKSSNVDALPAFTTPTGVTLPSSA